MAPVFRRDIWVARANTTRPEVQRAAETRRSIRTSQKPRERSLLRPDLDLKVPTRLFSNDPRRPWSRQWTGSSWFVHFDVGLTLLGWSIVRSKACPGSRLWLKEGLISLEMKLLELLERAAVVAKLKTTWLVINKLWVWLGGCIN